MHTQACQTRCMGIYTNSCCVCVCACVYLLAPTYQGPLRCLQRPDPRTAEKPLSGWRRTVAFPTSKNQTQTIWRKKSRGKTRCFKVGASELGAVGLGHQGWPNSLTHTGLMKGQPSALTAKKRPDHLLSCLALKRHLEVRIWPLKLNLGKQSF